MISSQSTKLTPEILPQASHWRSPPWFFQILCIRKINFWFPYAEANHFYWKQFYNEFRTNLHNKWNIPNRLTYVGLKKKNITT